MESFLNRRIPPGTTAAETGLKKLENYHDYLTLPRGDPVLGGQCGPQQSRRDLKWCRAVRHTITIPVHVLSATRATVHSEWYRNSKGNAAH